MLGPLLEINQEVIPEGVKNLKPQVRFLCGNPDRGMIAGSTYKYCDIKINNSFYDCI